MIRTFRDRGTEDLFDGIDSKASRRTCPVRLWKKARTQLALLHFAQELSDLSSMPGNRLHPLKGKRRGQYAIAINRQYRICFRWEDQGAEDVEVTDYH